MLGDTAIAVNPDDSCYKDLIGKHAVLPLVGRRIEIVGDDYADETAGSGAVKITPAHDFNDFEVGKRHHLKAINILTADAKITLRDNEDFLDGLTVEGKLIETIEELDGMDRFAARREIVAKMEEVGLLDRIEPHTHNGAAWRPRRCPIEPFLTDQWYVNAAEMAKPAIEKRARGPHPISC